MDFEEALLKFGFHPSTGRTPRGVQVLVAEPNPFLTYTVQAFDDGSALFTWEFAVGEYLRTKGIQFGSDETLNQLCSRARTSVVPRTAPGWSGAVERAQAQFASVRFDRP